MSLEIYDIALSEHCKLNGRYEIVKAHYLGNSGIVYFGINLENNEEVIIKEFIPHMYANRDMDGKSVVCKSNVYKEQFERMRIAFWQECEYVYKLREVNKPYDRCVVRYLDSFEANNTKYLVTEKIVGKSLQDYVDNCEDFSIRQVMTSLVDIVAEVHEKGIIHCDIKPSNIMLRDDGKLVLIDFGSACEKGLGNTGDELLFASRGFSAPELYTKGEIDELTDIYSIGAVVYYLMTDYQIPAPNEYDDGEFLPSISEFIEIPQNLDCVIMKALERDKKKRLSSLFLLKIMFNL